MSDDRIDPEMLAALLDGRLGPAERDRVLGILARDPEQFEIFAEAAATLRELEAVEAVAGLPEPGIAGTAAPVREPDADVSKPARMGELELVPGSTSPSRAASVGAARRLRRRWFVAAAALAAGLVAVAVIPRLRQPAALSPMEIASAVDVVANPGPGSIAARLGENWDQPGWSVTRGPVPEMVESARAFRLGVRAADAEIAIRARDSVALRLVGADLILLLSGVDAGAPAAALYSGVVDAGVRASEGERRGAAEALRALLGESPWFDLGVWAEGARLAGRSGSLSYFKVDGPAHRQLRHVADRLARESKGDSASALGIVRRIEEQMATVDGSAGALPALIAELIALASR